MCYFPGMSYVDRNDQRPRGIETYRSKDGRVMAEPPRGSTLKKGEVRKAAATTRDVRTGDSGPRSR